MFCQITRRNFSLPFSDTSYCHWRRENKRVTFLSMAWRKTLTLYLALCLQIKINQIYYRDAKMLPPISISWYSDHHNFGILLSWFVCLIYASLHKCKFFESTCNIFECAILYLYSFKWALYYSAGQIHFLVRDHNKIKVWGAIDQGNV